MIPAYFADLVVLIQFPLTGLCFSCSKITAKPQYKQGCKQSNFSHCILSSSFNWWLKRRASREK